jgi:apolipoprotein D and lipocalin family protein
MTFGCTGIPEGVEPIKGFDLNRYMGKWYEIARFDHSFERGLSKVTAEYTILENGGVQVLNRGFSVEKNKWNDAKGIAYLVGNSDIGHLKVSFFRPFYASYVIINLDLENYNYALVSGPNRSFLWILSRTPQLEDEIKNKLFKKAQELKFNTDNFIWVEH